MGFWFFGKKKGGSEAGTVTVAELEHMNRNLSASFSKIKGDVKVIRDWLDYFQTRDKDIAERLSTLESRLDELGEVVALVHEGSHEPAPKRQGKSQVLAADVEEPYYALDEPRSVLDSLTETQRAIFIRLGLLLSESGQEWVSVKALAQEIYPEKPYDQVRSTTSEYMGVLVDMGLVKKRRRGKLTYIQVTENGKDLLKKVKMKVKPKLREGRRREK